MSEGVRFVDNERNVDATILPLPDSTLETDGVEATPDEAPSF